MRVLCFFIFGFLLMQSCQHNRYVKNKSEKADSSAKSQLPRNHKIILSDEYGVLTEDTLKYMDFRLSPNNRDLKKISLHLLDKLEQDHFSIRVSDSADELGILFRDTSFNIDRRNEYAFLSDYSRYTKHESGDGRIIDSLFIIEKYPEGWKIIDGVEMASDEFGFMDLNNDGYKDIIFELSLMAQPADEPVNYPDDYLYIFIFNPGSKKYSRVGQLAYDPRTKKTVELDNNKGKYAKIFKKLAPDNQQFKHWIEAK